MRTSKKNEHETSRQDVHSVSKVVYNLPIFPQANINVHTMCCPMSESYPHSKSNAQLCEDSFHCKPPKKLFTTLYC